MIQDAVTYPYTGDEWVKRVVIGTVLLFGSVLILPAVPLMGYIYRTIQAGARDDPEPPAWEDWGGLSVDGLKLLAGFVVALVVPMVLWVAMSFVVFGGTMLAASTGSSAGIVAGAGLALLFVFGSFGFLLAVFYVALAAVTNMVVRDSLGALFEFGRIGSLALSGDFFVGVLASMAVSFVLGLVAGLLSLVLVGLLLLFGVQVSQYYLIGRGAGKALDIPDSGGSESAGSATASDPY
jgi:hypothetical protein